MNHALRSEGMRILKLQPRLDLLPRLLGMSDLNHFMPQLNLFAHNTPSNDKNENTQPDQNPTGSMLFSIRGNHRERHRNRTSSHGSYGKQGETSQKKPSPLDIKRCIWISGDSGYSCRSSQQLHIEKPYPIVYRAITQHTKENRRNSNQYAVQAAPGVKPIIMAEHHFY